MTMRARWAVAAAAVLLLSGCRTKGPRRAPDPAKRCVEAARERRPDALAVCEPAAAAGSIAALSTVASLHSREARYAEVIATAARVPAEVAPADRDAAGRAWFLAAEALVQLAREDEAWPLYERARAHLETPVRLSFVAMRLADRALDAGAIEDAAAHLADAIAYADAHRAPDAADRAFVALQPRLDTARALLRLGDRRAAEEVLATAAPLGAMAPALQPSIDLVAGEVAGLRGLPRAAAARYEACAAASDALGFERDADTAVLCHARRGVLALPDVAAAEAAWAAAAGHLAEATRGYAADADRLAEVAHLRALIDRARGRATWARAGWAALWRTKLGPGTRAAIAVPYADALAAHDPAAAEAVLAEAFAAVIALRDGHAVKEARRGLPGGLRATAEALVRLRLARGDRDGALAVIEEAQRRDFTDRLLAEGGGDATLAPRRGPARAGDAPGAAERDLAAVLSAAARTEAAQRRLDAIAVPRTPPRGAPAVIAFWSDARDVWRVAIAPGAAPAIARIADRAWIDARVEGARVDPAGEDAAQLGARLFPRAALPPAGAPLVIVPDAALAGLGFAALPADGAPLVARHALAIAPSIGLAWAWSARAHAGADGAVVLGDPAGDLPGAAAEARAAAHHLGTEPRLGPAATRAALAAAARADVLHVAAHAGTAGDATVLHLADGDVTIAELLGLALAPRVAVVASCASAAQRATAMWSSAAAALAAAGAGAVVGSLRSLDDATTGPIVADFYAAGGARDAIGALAIAQRRARARGVPAAAWAFLVVYGAPPSPTAATPAPAPPPVPARE